MVNSLAVDSEAKQTIEALQNELQKTKEKLQAVEELKKQSGIFFFSCQKLSVCLFCVMTAVFVVQLMLGHW